MWGGWALAAITGILALRANVRFDVNDYLKERRKRLEGNLRSLCPHVRRGEKDGKALHPLGIHQPTRNCSYAMPDVRASHSRQKRDSTGGPVLGKKSVSTECARQKSRKTQKKTGLGMSEETPRLPSVLLNPALSAALLLAGLAAVVGSAYASYASGNGEWFQRSGSVFVLVSVIVEIRLNIGTATKPKPERFLRRGSLCRDNQPFQLRVNGSAGLRGLVLA